MSTLGFLAPAAFFLAALLPVLIAMYLLKLRRTEQTVSSVYLWKRMVRDVEANAPWQKLRKNLLLIVQLLFLSFLILALARPFTRTSGIGGQAAILIFDTSASMAATDVAPTRLEAAKAQAQRMVDDLPDGARVTVIAAGEGARVLVSSSQDRRQARLGIDEIKASASGSDLTAAVELASAMAARQPDTEVVIFSDGNVTLPQRATIKGSVRYMPMGISGNNQAVTMLSLQTAPGGNLTAFIQVTNYGEAVARRRLTLYADGQPVNVYDLEIAAGSDPSSVRTIIADDLPPQMYILEAQLDGADVLSSDDRAWAVHRAGRTAAVTLVTEGNLFLETALSLFPNLQVTVVRPADYESGTAATTQPPNHPTTQPPNDPTAQPPALTILDAYIPITATLPPGNLLFIAPLRSTPYFTVTGQVEQPAPRAVNADDPLLAHVSLGEVSVLEATRMSLPAWARPVIAGDAAQGSTALLFAGEADGRRIAVLAFDLHRSDLPLNVAFPLLLSNLLGWLAPSGGSDLPTQALPGAPVALAVPPEAASVQVTRPDGSVVKLTPQEGQAVFADTAQLGVYRAAWDDGDAQPREVSFAVNLFSPQESMIKPAANLPLASVGASLADAQSQPARREWGRPLAWLALALLMLEWFIYQRATLAKMVAQVRRKT